MKKAFNRKSVFVKSLSVWSAFAVIVTTSAPAFAAGTAVLGGSAELTSHTRASLNAGTATDSYAQFIAEAGAASAVLDWSKFNVGTGKEMNFSGAGTTFFNLVDGALGRSEIDGVISGNGNVWVINPAGIAFGAGSSVNVGGLFAAAAGTLSNADALRSGTAFLPGFSSFDGKVNASKGSFTADQVALMGKTVAAAGDFTGAKNLTLAATQGASDVDDIQGGKVKVNIRDFAPDGSEITLGDLKIDGSLSIKTTGGVVVGTEQEEHRPGKAAVLLNAVPVGPIEAPSDENPSYDIVRQIEASDIDVTGQLFAPNGGIAVVATDGDVQVNAPVVAAGNVFLDASGDIGVNQLVESGYGNVSISAGGDLSLAGDVIADNGSMSVQTSQGSIGLAAGNGVAARGDILIQTASGNVNVGGTVVSAAGNVDVSAGALKGPDGYVVTGSGAVIVGQSGQVLAAKNATLVSGVGSSSGVLVDGKIQGVGGVEVSSLGGLGIQTSERSFVIAGAAHDAGDGTPVVDLATPAEFVSLNGLIALQGELIADNVNLSAYNPQTRLLYSIDALSGKEKRVNGVSMTGYNVLFSNANDLNVWDVNAVNEVRIGSMNGDVKVLGTVLTEGSVTLQSIMGDVTVAEGARVETLGRGDITMYAASGGTAPDHMANGSVKVDGTVSSLGNVLMWAASHRADGTADDPNIIYHDCGFGSVAVGTDGSVYARGKVDVLTGANATGGIVLDGTVSGDREVYAYSHGDHGISVGGDVTSPRHSELVAQNGNVTVKQDGCVSATGMDGVVVIRSAAYDGGKGHVVIEGRVAAEGDSSLSTDSARASVSLEAALGKDSSGNVIIRQGAEVGTTKDGAMIQIATAEAEGARGKVDIAGQVFADGDNSRIFIWSGYADNTAGKLKVRDTGSISTSGESSEIKLWSARGKNSRGNMRVDGTISAVGQLSDVMLFGSYGEGAVGNVKVSDTGRVYSRGAGGSVEITASHGAHSTGNVSVSGQVDAWRRLLLGASEGEGAIGSVSLDGIGCSGGYYVGSDALTGDNYEFYENNFASALIAVANGKNATGGVDVSGRLISLGLQGNCSITAAANEGAKASVTIADSGELMGFHDVHVLTKNGNVTMNGRMDAFGEGGRTAIWALNGGGAGLGHVTFGDHGGMVAVKSAEIIADGNLSQPSAVVGTRGGYSQPVSLPMATKAENVVLIVGGDVGTRDSYFAVDGKVRAVVTGNAAIAAAGDTNYRGSSSSISSSKELIEAVEISAQSGDVALNTAMTGGETGPSVFAEVPEMGGVLGSDVEAATTVGGDLHIYTSGRLDANGLLKAGGNLTVSAASFGDMSYLQAGGKLSINNVGHPAYPQIAYFESIDGKEPKINNQPNDMVIFVDGRLAGGNLNILNKFGADEAFMVETPELKSTQGIFGNPPFLHSDLDVANPMEVSAIDYLLQEVPRLTLSSDFPAEVDQSIEAVGLGQKDSYWFGLKDSDEGNQKRDSSGADENTAGREDVKVDGPVAMNF